MIASSPAIPRHPVARRRHGLTLVEVLVVLAVLAIATAVTAPALVTPRDETATIGQVVRAARSAAIARGEWLSLAVAARGEWVLAHGADSAVLARGAVDPAPGAALRLALTPTGGCIPGGVLPPGWGGWDVAHCTATGAGR